jgi:23S rRNA pseudouridine1911/1915/1917 synthase
MTVREQTIRVEASRPGDRLDSHLRSLFPMISRGAFQRMIEEGNITVNGAPVKATHHPRAGEEIRVVWPEAKPAEAVAQEMPLDILFEDADLLVLNKTAGLVVHPAAGNPDGTLVNGLLHHCAGQLSGIGGVARPGIVHRLDRDTSGCLVVAKNDETHLALSRQFAARSTEKTYLAIVCGQVEPSSGEVSAAIARHPTHRKRMAAREGQGRSARTTYRVIERLNHATLVEATLHTGRTHQARVHFQYLGFPVVGDETYGKRHNNFLSGQTGYTAARQMLHAWKLSFEHPRSKLRVKIQAPLPPDFLAALSALGGGENPVPSTPARGTGPQALAEPIRCPLCGQPNNCAMARGDKDATGCWCRDATISAESLSRVPLAKRHTSCLCQKCAGGPSPG